MNRALYLALLGFVAVALSGCKRDAFSDLRSPKAQGSGQGDITEARFSRDGKYLFCKSVPTGKDPHARETPNSYVVWDATTGGEVGRLTPPAVLTEWSSASGDGTLWLAYLSADTVATSRYAFLEVGTDERVTGMPVVPGKNGKGGNPSLSDDYKWLALSDFSTEEKDRQGHIFSREKDGWKFLRSVPGEHPHLSPDGRRVVTVARVDDEISLRAWSVSEGRLLWSAECRTFGLIGFTRDGKYVIQDDQTDWKLHDANNGEKKLTMNLQKPFLAAYADGKVIAVQGEGLQTQPAITRWDAETGEQLSRRPLAHANVLKTQNHPFSSKRLALAVGGEDRPLPGKENSQISVTIVEVYDPKDAAPVTTLKLPSHASVALSPDGRTLAQLDFPSFYPIPE